MNHYQNGKNNFSRIPNDNWNNVVRVLGISRSVDCYKCNHIRRSDIQRARYDIDIRNPLVVYVNTNTL